MRTTKRPKGVYNLKIGEEAQPGHDRTWSTGSSSSPSSLELKATIRNPGSLDLPCVYYHDEEEGLPPTPRLSPEEAVLNSPHHRAASRPQNVRTSEDADETVDPDDQHMRLRPRTFRWAYRAREEPGRGKMAREKCEDYEYLFWACEGCKLKTAVDEKETKVCFWCESELVKEEWKEWRNV
ncbi:hypothetical protein EX30DRAFT_370703 [Ascodesmis nigricans]|uniref:Uncharacterized protein n=1 Tax=Ascodesmis nigricans TaxID=341454 RepID=A0A4S2MZK9_9PEZI|nr:hypothetical protein EX30DRAFT_370703 [Ascodesmis nigricans]